MNKQKEKRNKQKRWPWVIGGIVLLFGLWHLISNFYLEEEKELRSQFRYSVKERFPEQAAHFSSTFGLFSFEADPQLPREIDPTQKTVVLIHGLDDPGKVWQSLAPVLAKEKFDVWLMQYPNDQPVVESSRLFYEELLELRQQGIRRFSIIAHSMGGLVTRDMLTSPEIGYKKSAEQGEVPKVDSFIMVGTPNHGSQLSRFRAFGELRDHLARLTNGEANWLGFILDGAGEAKIDLLPGSRFLIELNSREHPEDVDMSIIAGITSPWDESDINRWLNSLREKIPDNHQSDINAFGTYLTSMTHDLGDGLVTVESTRLEGIPHQTVSGTHLSMIRNITQNSQRMPPAVPLIVSWLKNDILL